MAYIISYATAYKMVLNLYILKDEMTLHSVLNILISALNGIYEYENFSVVIVKQ